jgi:hypothetical protein
LDDFFHNGVPFLAGGTLSDPFRELGATILTKECCFGLGHSEFNEGPKDMDFDCWIDVLIIGLIFSEANHQKIKSSRNPAH